MVAFITVFYSIDSLSQTVLSRNLELELELELKLGYHQIGVPEPKTAAYFRGTMQLKSDYLDLGELVSLVVHLYGHYANLKTVAKRLMKRAP